MDIPAGITSSPPPLPQSPPPSVSQTTAAPKTEMIQSPTKPQAAARAKPAEASGRKSITSLGSVGSVGAEPSIAMRRSPSPTSKSTAGPAPLPEIQITRTESNRSTVDEKWVKPEKMDEGKRRLRALAFFAIVMSISHCLFVFFQEAGPSKVVKRRAPAPISDAADISISRPVVTRVDHGKGMIPPPPIKLPAPATGSATATTAAAATASGGGASSSMATGSKPEPFVRPVSPKPGDRRPSTSASPRKSAPSPPPPKPLASISSSFAPQSMESITGSSESLVKSTEPSSEANQAAASPPSLRVQRKVNDVTTIKRQPKTGWL